MNEEEWLTREARAASAFVAYGGLDALVRQSSSRASRHGGLKSVTVVQEERGQEGHLVTLRVDFMESTKKKTVPAMAVNEEMIWRIAVLKEDGAWKLSF